MIGEAALLVTLFPAGRHKTRLYDKIPKKQKEQRTGTGSNKVVDTPLPVRRIKELLLYRSRQ
jgi:hypothetical protein